MLSNNNTFIITILNNQHATWQGTITWVNTKNTQHFRSALELIKLIDSVVGQSEDALDASAIENYAEINPCESQG